MKVLLFSSMPHDMDAGSPIRGRSIRKGLEAQGEIVEVVTPFLGNPADVLKEHNINDYTSIEDALATTIESFTPDVLYSITHGYLNIVSKVARQYALPFAVDLHAIRSLELFTESHSRFQFLQLFWNALRWEKHLLKASLITAANPMLYKWVARVLPQTKAIIGIADDGFFAQNPKATSKKLRILYCGNLHKYQGIEVLLGALERLSPQTVKQVEFTLITTYWGDESIRTTLLKAQEKELVNIIPPVPHAKFSELLFQFDVAIIPRPLCLATYLAFPQKLVECMSAGLCVIASDIAPHRYAITHKKNGLLCKPDPENLAEAITECFNDKNREAVAFNARNYAENNFSCESQCKKIIQYLYTAANR